jgi:hypothetical protein
MAQHRFRTAALIGEWRPTYRQACQDALRAGQARDEERAPGFMVWAVPGEIERDRPEHLAWKEPQRTLHRSS